MFLARVRMAVASLAAAIAAAAMDARLGRALLTVTVDAFHEGIASCAQASGTSSRLRNGTSMRSEAERLLLPGRAESTECSKSVSCVLHTRVLDYGTMVSFARK